MNAWSRASQARREPRPPLLGRGGLREQIGHAAGETGKDVAGVGIKNLFLRNKKGDRHYLVILAVDKQADLRQLVKIIGDDRLSFGSPERLMTHLGVTPGSVSVFGLLHEGSGPVQVIVPVVPLQSGLVGSPLVTSEPLIVQVPPE